MLCQKHRHAELPVDALDGVEKAPCRKRVEHTRRLIEDQKLRVHRHHGREVQHLLLPAGKLAGFLPEPAFHAEKSRHFRDSAPDNACRKRQIFKPERKLVPDIIRHDLILRILLDIADFGKRRLRVKRFQRCILIKTPPEPASRRAKLFFYLF